MKPLEALRALGPGPEPSAASRQRIAAGLASALGPALLGSPPAPPAPPALGAALAPAARAALAPIAAAWLVGGLMGAAVYGALRPPTVQVIYVERPSSVPSALPSAPPVFSAPAAAPSSVTAGVPSASRVSSHVPSSMARPLDGAASQLARERALLDQARASSGAGEFERALAQIEQHESEFPQGMLSEEREAMAIQALRALGRNAEAVRRTDAFRGRYPNSFLAPALAPGPDAP